jgi:RNA polymerase sigma-70 factor (ECF subfamily)
MRPAAEVTELLERSRAGDEGAMDELLPLVYEELLQIADRYLVKERNDHTLQATALVHEAYLRLIDQHSRDWQNRGHFLALAATAMRRILVNHAHAHNAAKRGGRQGRVTLHEVAAEMEARAFDLVALDEALQRLAQRDEQSAKIVERRFFAGLTEAEIAQLLGVSTRTVERGWRLARAWLKKEIGAGDEPGPQAG